MFNQLRTFKTVFETQNFSLAAKTLFIAQPTVSVHIQQLEKQFGQKLFERSGRRDVYPTNAGKILYERVNRLLDDWQSIDDAMQQEIPSEKTKVRIGASHTTAIYVLPKIVYKLSETMPNVELTIHMANSETILQQIKQHELDFGLIEKPIVEAGVKRNDYGLDQLVLAGDKESQIWLVREAGSGVGHFTRAYLQEKDIQPKQIMYVNSNELIVQLLKQGFGKTILSKQAVPHNVKQVRLSDKYQRHFYLLSRGHLSEELANIEKHILAWQAEVLA
ncbi:LysR family transcriptional regulator [Lactobacillus sp. CC-MHH1034]|uniref:LysR family transcriptional regulator n=1 Tax=Agrilactobacillus fermenti TaxID=2586909 RepID=UPI001E4D7394|nr:LysR family transcriptional regulator [Agrilactobacillus fermenti]MCD2256003.1 LysR family transcriptional regulator [Agrilactobacillus fermenti]